MKKVYHELEPFYKETSEILILGSIPSPKSREIGFYYAHPQNRFWKVLAKLYNEKLPISLNDKKLFLEKHKIALWDVLSSCNINGASDSSIKNPKFNNINKLIKNTNIKKVFTTGRTAYNLYNKNVKSKTKIEGIYLPSTSPANCKLSLEDLTKEYEVLLK